MSQFQHRFWSLKQELLGGRRTVSPLQEIRAAPLSFSQPEPCHKLQLLTVNRAHPVLQEGRKMQIELLFSTEHYVTNITSFSLPAQKKSPILHKFCDVSMFLPKKKWPNNGQEEPVPQTLAFSTKHHCVPQHTSSLQQVAPGPATSALRAPGQARPQSTAVWTLTVVLHGHALLRHRNNPAATTYQSVYEDFSSFFTLMESIYISQLLKQVHHSYGNMCRC